MNIAISKPLCYTEKGKKPNQEDSLFPPEGEATQDTRVFIVCDGMGGHEHGEVASACVAETIGMMTVNQQLCSTIEMRSLFEKALQQAYANLDELDKSDVEKKMGTTLTFLAICTDGMLLAHVGDSRIYQLRPGKGVVFQTRDHSLVNDLIASGELTEQEARTFPQRNVITRAIQPHQEYPAKATFNVITDIRKDDLFLLCCDGVTEQLNNDDICRLMLSPKTLDKRIADVRNECKARGTKDNNTAYAIEICNAEDDSVEVMTAQEEDTVQPKAKKDNKMRIVIILLAFVIVAILAYIFLSVLSDDKADKTPAIQKKEQVQGTISRHKK